MDAKQLGRRLFMECWDAGKFAVLDEILDADHKFHLPEGDLDGIPAYREMLEGYYQAFNPTFEIMHVIGEGDYAAIHYTDTGNFVNDLEDSSGMLKATGQSYSTFGVELIYTKKGKIIEAWPGHQSLAHYTQVGLYVPKVD